MKELLYVNYKQNTILSYKLVVGLRSTIDPRSSKDVGAEATTKHRSIQIDVIYENSNY